MNREGRYVIKSNGKTKFWEIIYYMDINEVLVRSGTQGQEGKIKIYTGFDGNPDKLIKKKTDEKLKKGWKHMRKCKVDYDKMYDLRIEQYDFDGKKKKPSIKKSKKKKSLSKKKKTLRRKRKSSKK